MNDDTKTNNTATERVRKGKPLPDIELTTTNAKSIQQPDVHEPPQIPNAQVIDDDISLEPSHDDITDDNDCCECFNPDTFRATMSIILFILLYFIYAGDILSMFALLLPTSGGGIVGCVCKDINTINDCEKCWNCITLPLSPESEAAQCINFDSKMDIIQFIFPILLGYCAGGWLLIETTIWIRMCYIGALYDKESVIYKEKRDKKNDQFILENNSQCFPTLRLDEMSIKKRQQTLVEYDAGFDQDNIGLIPCCFDDIDKYHMKKVLMMNMEQDEVLLNANYDMERIDDDTQTCCTCCAFPGEIGASCCEFPCFMFGFSLNMWLLFPFRYFWTFAVWDLNSAFWKRICWHCAFHCTCFDVCWVLFCACTYQLMQQAEKKGINSSMDALAPFIERKIVGCLAMGAITVVVWLTVSIYAIARRSARENDYNPVRTRSNQ